MDGVGCQVSEDNDKVARSILEKAAKEGDKQAMHNLGWMYKNGRGCSVDYEAARQLFLSAGRPSGDMYEHGLGIPADLAIAMEYYSRGAEEGSEKAKKG